jgi:vacuolar-type H+-ATPase subunit C/Vma6
MYDYGNARIAGRRGRLVDAATMARLAESDSPAAVLAQLERDPRWRELLRAVRQVAADPSSVMELGIERFRAGELASLPGWYEGRARHLVEALVMDIDRERVLAILRRRRAGQDAEAINPTITPGALLHGELLAELARQPTRVGLFRLLGQAGVIGAADAVELAGLPADASAVELEAAVGTAWERAREMRAGGGGRDGRHVRELLAAEHAERETVHAELGGGGPSVGALVERTLRLARLSGVAAAGRRDPEGIGTVAGYVAAVELQAIRLRAVLARVAAGWSVQMTRSYLAASGA